MRKKHIPIFICFILIGIFVIAYFTTFRYMDDFDYSVYIFSDISECNNLIEQETDAKMETYDSPSKDKNVADLEYEKFFGGTYSSSQLTFEIFAYEFSSERTAKQYFYNETGKESERDENYSRSLGGFGKFRMIVISGKNAYVAYTERDTIEVLMKILENTFTKQISFS